MKSKIWEVLLQLWQFWRGETEMECFRTNRRWTVLNSSWEPGHIKVSWSYTTYVKRRLKSLPEIRTELEQILHYLPSCCRGNNISKSWGNTHLFIWNQILTLSLWQLGSQLSKQSHQGKASRAILDSKDMSELQQGLKNVQAGLLNWEGDSLNFIVHSKI